MLRPGTIYQAPELSELFKSALCQSAVGALGGALRHSEDEQIPKHEELRAAKAF